jgi:hypothetical protein
LNSKKKDCISASKICEYGIGLARRSTPKIQETTHPLLLLVGDVSHHSVELIPHGFGSNTGGSGLEVLYIGVRDQPCMHEMIDSRP